MVRILLKPHAAIMGHRGTKRDRRGRKRPQRQKEESESDGRPMTDDRRRVANFEFRIRGQRATTKSKVGIKQNSEFRSQEPRKNSGRRRTNVNNEVQKSKGLRNIRSQTEARGLSAVVGHRSSVIRQISPFALFTSPNPLLIYPTIYLAATRNFGSLCEKRISALSAPTLHPLW